MQEKRSKKCKARIVEGLSMWILNLCLELEGVICYFLISFVAVALSDNNFSVLT